MTETTELKALEGAVKRDLELLAYPAKEWVTRVRRARQKYTAASRGAGFRHGVLEHRTVDIRGTAAADA